MTELSSSIPDHFLIPYQLNSWRKESTFHKFGIRRLLQFLKKLAKSRNMDPEFNAL